jgi:hypothetical protein
VEDVHPGGAGPVAVLDAAVWGARAATASSVATLAPLAAAGVLDAGACGFVLVLDALRVACSSKDGGMAAMLVPVVPDVFSARGSLADNPSVQEMHDSQRVSDKDEVEVMFVLRRPSSVHDLHDAAVADTLRTELGRIGGSVVVVGGSGTGSEDGVWQAHVHTPDLPAAFEMVCGWARHGRVEPLYVRHLAVPDADLAVVATATAPGLAAELARAGAVVLLPVPPASISGDDLISAALSESTRSVLVLDPTADARTVNDRLLGRGTDPARTAHDSPAVTVLDAPTELHAVVALAALASSPFSAASSGTVDDALYALGNLRVATCAPDTAPATLHRLLALQPGVIVTILADDGVPPDVLDLLQLTVTNDGGECVLLHTGRPGARVSMGVES